jgi:hypothetical protein
MMSLLSALLMVPTGNGLVVVAPALTDEQAAIRALAPHFAIGAFGTRVKSSEIGHLLQFADSWWGQHGHSLTAGTVRSFGQALQASRGDGEVVIFLGDARENRCVVVRVSGGEVEARLSPRLKYVDVFCAWPLAADASTLVPLLQNLLPSRREDLVADNVVAASRLVLQTMAQRSGVGVGRIDAIVARNTVKDSGKDGAASTPVAGEMAQGVLH